MGAAGGAHRPLSRELVEHLIARKQAVPSLSVLLITDPINDVYGGAPSPLLAELRKRRHRSGHDRPRAAARLESGCTRRCGACCCSGGATPPGGGIDANPFASGRLEDHAAQLAGAAELQGESSQGRRRGSRRRHARGAGHLRQSARREQRALERGAALRRRRSPATSSRAKWRSRASPAGADISMPPRAEADAAGGPARRSRCRSSPRKRFADTCSTRSSGTRNGDAVSIATFYLSDRKVLDALLAAADRGVRVRIILDPNRDAFGRQKDGVPNRPVANELVTRERRADRGALVSHARRAIPYQARADPRTATASSHRSARRTSRAATSATTTSKRTSRSKLPADSPLAIEMIGYFDRLWNNDGPPGTEFTAPFGAYRDEDRATYWRYRLMEATGLSTFW